MPNSSDGIFARMDSANVMNREQDPRHIWLRQTFRDATKGLENAEQRMGRSRSKDLTPEEQLVG